MRRRTIVAAALAGAALGTGILWWATPTAGSRLEAARGLAIKGKYEEAVAAYRAVLNAVGAADRSVRPERVEALARLGDLLYLHRGEPEAAADAYRRVILEAPAHRESWAAREKLADIARNHLRDLPEAIAHEQALAASGQTGADRFGYRVAKGYLELRDFEQCRREARDLIDADPGGEWTDDALFLIATAWQLEGKHAEAIEALRELIVRFPGTNAAARALHGVGGEQVALGQLEAALDTYLAVLPVHPEPARVQPDITRVRRLIDEARRARDLEGGREAHLTR